MQINGTLKYFIHNDKVMWLLQDDTDNIDGVYVIKNGDYLKIFKEEQSIWEGTINFVNTDESFCDIFYDKMQQNVDSELWFDWFHNEYSAIIIKNDIIESKEYDYNYV